MQETAGARAAEGFVRPQPHIAPDGPYEQALNDDQLENSPGWHQTSRGDRTVAHHRPMPFARDPLSVGYDPVTSEILEWCRSNLFARRQVLVRSPAGDLTDARGLSRHERAFQRSIFYVLNSTDSASGQGGRWAKNPDWSILVRWGDRVWSERSFLVWSWGERRRYCWVEMVPGYLASDAWARIPEEQRYTVNPDEQSQALGL